MKEGWSQDSSVGRCGVSISPQLGHLLATGGGSMPKETGGTPERTGCVGPWGHRKEAERRTGEAGGRGPPRPQTGGAGEERRVFAPPT